MSRQIFRGFAAVLTLTLAAALACIGPAPRPTPPPRGPAGLHRPPPRQDQAGKASGESRTIRRRERGHDKDWEALAIGELRRLGSVCRTGRKFQDLLRAGDAQGQGSPRIET